MGDIREELTKAFDSVEAVEKPAELPAEPISQEVKVNEPSVQPENKDVPLDQPEDKAQESEKTELQDKQPITPAAEKALNKAERPPSSWKADAKAQWESVPPALKQEIHRREKEFNKFVQETATPRAVYDDLGKILQPHMELFTNANVHPLAVVNNLLNQGAVLWSGSPEEKAKMAVKILQDCGVQPELVDKFWGDAITAKKDPNLNYLQELIQQELAPIKQTLGQQIPPQVSQQKQTAADPAIVDELEQFAAAHQHFYDVKDDMADIMELLSARGQQISLQEAYDRALSMNGLNTPAKPDPSNLSVGGSPVGSRAPINAGDLRGTIEAAFNNIRV